MNVIYFLLGLAIVLGSLFLCFRRIQNLVANLKPIRLNADATGFADVRHAQWRVTCVTGQVLAANLRVQNHIHVDNFSDGPRVRQTTTFHDRIRLLLSNGRQEEVQLVDFNVSPEAGDVVTLWYASNESKTITFAVLNHTTGRQFINDASLQKVLQSNSNVGMFLMPFVWIVVGIASGFTLMFVGMGFCAWYLWKKYTLRRDFVANGTAPLWQASAHEAEILLVH